MRKIENIVIHEAQTPPWREVTVADIDSWHRKKGWLRKPTKKKAFNPHLTSIGYQYVIYLDGSLHTGRAEDEIPAAVANHNATSINICLAGSGKYTPEQWESLQMAVTMLKGKYPAAAVKGHRQFDTAIAQGKTCPGFDVPAWYESGMVPPAGHILRRPAA